MHARFSYCRDDQGILPQRLDVKAFAGGRRLAGHDPFVEVRTPGAKAKGMPGPCVVDWEATGEYAPQALGGMGRSGSHLVRAPASLWVPALPDAVDVPLGWIARFASWPTKPRPGLDDDERRRPAGPEPRV